MRIILLLFLPFLVFSQSIKVDEKTQQKLGIKLYTVRQEEVKEKLTLPATVSEYAGLVAEVYSPSQRSYKKTLREGRRQSQEGLSLGTYILSTGCRPFDPNKERRN
jgi:hypothetical protein